MCPINVNPKTLRRKLIRIYTDYISDDVKKNDASRKAAVKADGLWSGAFMLDKDLESGVGCLVWFYVNPRLSKDRAKQILENLSNAESKYSE